MEILFGLVLLIATWHGFKYGTPRAMRAIGNRRANSINSWSMANPGAPKSARWAAGVARSIAALRWGPGYFKREFAKAFREAWDTGKQKYKLAPAPVPAPTAKPVQPAGQRPQPASRPPSPTPAPSPTGRPHLHSVPTTTAPNDTNARSNTMPAATTIEVSSPETLHAAMQSKVEGAAAELEDARADANRAASAVAEIERTVASLTKLKLKAEDVAQVKALLEPDQMWLAAAQSRIAAADQRLAAAKAALTMATRHVELQAAGAAGDFYTRSA